MRRERDHAINLLDRLHILSTVQSPGKPRAYKLTNPFAASLRDALTGAGRHKSFGVPVDPPEEDAVTVADLDYFARQQWEGVLAYMVGSAGIDLASNRTEIGAGVTALLRMGRLVDVRGRRVEITQGGFAFILQEVNAQVWTILILYLQNAEAVCFPKTLEPTRTLSSNSLHE